MKVTAKALEKGPGGWAGTTEDGQRKVLGAGSWLRAGGGGRCCLTVSKSVCALHRSCLHRRHKRGQGVPQWGGLAWWGRGLKLEGEVKEGEEGRDSVCLYIYIEI